MRHHRCTDFYEMNLPCPMKELEEAPGDNDDDEGVDPPPPWLMFPAKSERAMPGSVTERMIVADAFANRFGEGVRRGQLAAFAFAQDFSFQIPWKDGAIVQVNPDPEVGLRSVRTREFKGVEAWIVMVVSIAAAAAIGFVGPLGRAIFNAQFGALPQFGMASIGAPVSGSSATPPGGGGKLFEAPRFDEQPGEFFDRMTEGAVVEGPPPTHWFGSGDATAP